MNGMCFGGRAKLHGGWDLFLGRAKHHEWVGFVFLGGSRHHGLGPVFLGEAMVILDTMDGWVGPVSEWGRSALLC